MQVFLNHGFIDAEHASINPLSAGFMYGYGVFETIKVYGTKAIFLQEHYQRFQNALFRIGQTLEYSFQEISDICEKLIHANLIHEGCIKIVGSKNIQAQTDLLIYTNDKVYVHEYKAGFKLCVATARRNESSKLCFIKSMNYADNIMQKEQALKLGFDEALFLNSNDNICEGCISNIFWVKENIVFTPSVECGLLSGIARQKTLQLCRDTGSKVVEGRFFLKDIQNADEIFITNSLMDIMPVSIFEGKRFDVNKLVFVNKLISEYKLHYYTV